VTASDGLLAASTLGTSDFAQLEVAKLAYAMKTTNPRIRLKPNSRHSSRIAMALAEAITFR
jgi:hypothetical protein